MCFAPGYFRLNICPPKSHAEPPGASYGTQIDAVAAQWRYTKIYPPITLKLYLTHTDTTETNRTRDHVANWDDEFDICKGTGHDILQMHANHAVTGGGFGY